MACYGVDPLVSIKVDDVVTTFYPSHIDNSKIMIGCKNSFFRFSSWPLDFDVITLDSEWKYKQDQIKLAKEKRRERPYPITQLKPHPSESTRH